MVDLAKYIKC